MIGERIKEARIALGYSAEQVAAHLGISPATVYRYEKGDISKLPAKFIKPLADFLSISPSELMEWNDRDWKLNLQLFAGDDKESRLISAYRSLSPRGQELLIERSEELKLLYGKKPEDSSAESV